MTEEELLLTCIMEECSEIQKACSKALRFGPEDIGPNERFTNIESIHHKFNDLYTLLALYLVKEYPQGIIEDRLVDLKLAKYMEWRLYSQSKGTINAKTT